MAFIKVSLDAFPSLTERIDTAEGYSEFSLESLKEHGFYEEIHKMLTAIKPDFNVNNVFTLEGAFGFPKGLYTFTLCQSQQGTAILQFGSGTSDNNVVEVTTAVETVDGEEIEVFKAGKATLRFSANNFNGVNVTVCFGKNSMGVSHKFIENIELDHIDQCQTPDDLAELLTTIGTYGYKLTDFVRPLVRKGIKNLPGAIVVYVKSWVVGAKHPEYGTSVAVSIEYKGDVLIKSPTPGKPAELKKGFLPAEILTKDGDIVTKPTMVYINTTLNSGGFLASDEGAKAAYQALNSGGEVRIIITGIPKREPEKYMPTNTIQIIQGNQKSKLFQQAQLEPAKRIDLSDLVQFSDLEDLPESFQKINEVFKRKIQERLVENPNLDPKKETFLMLSSIEKQFPSYVKNVKTLHDLYEQNDVEQSKVSDIMPVTVMEPEKVTVESDDDKIPF